MAVSVRQRKKQAKLFAQRAYDAAKDAERITRDTERLINKAVRGGKTPDELKQIFAKEARKAENHARTAAQTDVTRIENQARNDLYNELRELDVSIIKIWNTIMDGAQRDSHGDINGEMQFTEDNFSIGGKFPADPALPPEERYRCRCFLTSEILDLHKISEKQNLINIINERTDRMLKELE